MFTTGHQVVQVHVIFTLPDPAIKILFPNRSHGPPKAQHLAYVEWFSPFPQTPARHHRLYKLTRTIRNNERLASILPIQSFRRSIHLFPQCGPSVPRDWTPATVLEECQHFLVNSFSDRHAHVTIR